MDLRGFLKKEIVIKREVSPYLEMAKILHENPEKTVFFEKCNGGGLKAVGNLCPTRERLCSALGTDKGGYIGRVLEAVGRPVAPILSDDESCLEVKEKGLSALPILHHFKGDAGKFITSGMVIAHDPEHGRNVSVHRLQVLDEKHVAIRLVERHLYMYHQRAEREGRPLDVAISIGVHPAVLFAASYSVPLGRDEFKLASSFLGGPLELTKCETVDLEVPAMSEVVIEGRMLPGKRVDEGPFVDITGTYDVIRKQPVIEITKISHKKDAIYHALLPSGGEHRMFMGMPREPKIYAEVSKVAKASNVCLTEGGVNWLHGVVSIKREIEGDSRNAINAALKAHPSMKQVVIVDDDIDVFEPRDVEFAIATRFQGHKDLVLIKDAKGSSLDPSAEDGRTTKLCIDATKNLGREKDFEKAAFD
ncbi:MAG: UbiD family decarboxylase [Candidatus Hydrothermarchaeaceae archaeon]